MTEHEFESGEESIDEEGRNETQQRIDEDGPSDAPADADWGAEENETEGSPAQGEEGQQPA
jgi:hypothetical protein